MALFRPSSSLRRRLSCCVCFDQYDGNDHVPKFLPCQHSVCSSCLTKLPRNGSKISCPQCRAEHQVPSGGFPTNRAVLDIVGELPNNDNTDTVMKCKDHGSSNCMLVCMDCLDGLCPKCVTGKSHASHKLGELDEAQAKLKSTLEKVLREKQNALASTRSKFSGCPTNVQINKAKSDVKDICSKMRKCLSDWEKRQGSLIASWKSDAEMTAARLESGTTALRNIQSSPDLLMTKRNLNRVSAVQIPGHFKSYSYETNYQDLLKRLHQINTVDATPDEVPQSSIFSDSYSPDRTIVSSDEDE